MTDRELYIYANTVLRSLDSNEAAATIASRFNLSYDSVRGRLSRAAKVPANRVALLQALAVYTEEVDPSIARQKKIMDESLARWKQFNVGQKTAAFISDAHLPYFRADALELTINILSDVKPDLITAGNDAVDNAGFGRWEDDRRSTDKVWSGDLAYRRSAEQVYYEMLSNTLSDGGVLAQVQGNHDNWFYSSVRKATPQTAETQIAEEMEHLLNCGVLQFSRGYHENYLELGKGLVFWHGQFASKLSTTNARNTLSQFMTDGVARSVVVGHTHRPSRVEGSTVGLHGVTFINNGCLSRVENVPYLRRDPKGWGLSITIAEYDASTRHHSLELVRFEEANDQLQARHNGKKYIVAINKEVATDY